MFTKPQVPQNKSPSGDKNKQGSPTQGKSSSDEKNKSAASDQNKLRDEVNQGKEIPGSFVKGQKDPKNSQKTEDEDTEDKDLLQTGSNGGL